MAADVLLIIAEFADKLLREGAFNGICFFFFFFSLPRAFLTFFCDSLGRGDRLGSCISQEES